MSKIFGIDVSFWQGDFDFKKAKNEGVQFVILRGMYLYTFADVMALSERSSNLSKMTQH